MEQNNKILLFSVLILLIGVISFNFNTISGAQVKGNDRAIITNPVLTCDTGTGYGRTRVPVTVNLIDGGTGKSYESDVQIRDSAGYRTTGQTYSIASSSYVKAGETFTFYVDCTRLKFGEGYVVRFNEHRSSNYLDSENTLSRLG